MYSQSIVWNITKTHTIAFSKDLPNIFTLITCMKFTGRFVG